VLLIRLAGFFFAFVQITLALRLLIPFVTVPDALEDFVPPLLVMTDWWLAPFNFLLERLDVLGVEVTLPTAVVDGEIVVPTEFEPAVVVAMVGWAIIAAFFLFVLRLIFRPFG
jgi:hypothetical protein